MFFTAEGWKGLRKASYFIVYGVIGFTIPRFHMRKDERSVRAGRHSFIFAYFRKRDTLTKKT